MLRTVIAAAADVAVWIWSDVLLDLFFAVLFACILRGVTDCLAVHTCLPAGVALALVVIAVALAALGIAYWMVPELVGEENNLMGTYPVFGKASARNSGYPRTRAPAWPTTRAG